MIMWFVIGGVQAVFIADGHGQCAVPSGLECNL